MELSLAGLIGAVVGTMVSAVFYGPLVDAVERALRRGILAADMLLCAGLGYWVGLKFGG
jgi:hypothetical protein